MSSSIDPAPLHVTLGVTLGADILPSDRSLFGKLLNLHGYGDKPLRMKMRWRRCRSSTSWILVLSLVGVSTKLARGLQQAQVSNTEEGRLTKTQDGVALDMTVPGLTPGTWTSPTLLTMAPKDEALSLWRPSSTWLVEFLLPLSHPPQIRAEAPAGRNSDNMSNFSMWLTLGLLVIYVLHEFFALTWLFLNSMRYAVGEMIPSLHVRSSGASGNIASSQATSSPGNAVLIGSGVAMLGSVRDVIPVAGAVDVDTVEVQIGDVGNNEEVEDVLAIGPLSWRR